MVKIEVKDIASLREETGLPIMEVKKALEEANGSREKALEFLKKSGALKAAKKADRDSNNGIIEAYVHGEGKIGVIVEVSCETDFVALNREFQDLAHDLAMQIAAADPKYISKNDIPESEINEQKELITDQLKSENKPKEVLDKIVEGRLGKYSSEICLLEQPFIKDQTITVGEYLTSKIAKIGENITIKRFARYGIGC